MHAPREHTQGPPQQQGQQRGRQPQQQRSEQQAREWQQRRGWQQSGAWQGEKDWRQSRARRWENEHRSWGQRGGYGGAYIPESRFRMYFGPQHYFRIRTRPVMYRGYARFAYGGFSFLLVDPYPESWSTSPIWR